MSQLMGKTIPDSVWTTNVSLMSFSFKESLCNFSRNTYCIRYSFEFWNSENLNFPCESPISKSTPCAQNKYNKGSFKYLSQLKINLKQDFC